MEDNFPASSKLMKAIQSLHGGELKLQAGVYKLDHGDQQVLKRVSGVIKGAGRSVTRIECTDLSNACLHFVNADHLELRDLSVAFAAKPVTRTGVPAILVSESTYTVLDQIEIYNSPSSAILVQKSTGLSVDGILVHDNLANGILLGNVQNARVNNVDSKEDSDAAFEASFYDEHKEFACRSISVTNVRSFHDGGGILINGCADVKVENFSATTSYGAGLTIISDTRTTACHFPGGISVAKGTVEGSGFYKGSETQNGVFIGTNFEGSPPYSRAVCPAETTANNHIEVTDLTVNHVKKSGVVVYDPGGKYNLSLDRIKVSNVGKGGFAFDLTGTNIQTGSLTSNPCGNHPTLLSAKPAHSTSQIGSCPE